MLGGAISRLIILTFGTLYPAYASYKAIRTKNVKEYVKWMMYWIVYALFTCIETFTDIFCSWFPFYYEVKIILILWLLSPATRGSSTLYRKFVHPLLSRNEEEIDQYISQAKDRGYSVVFQLGSKGVNYATNVIMQTAIKGGGNLVQTFKKSYSLSDISETDSVMHTVEESTKVISVQPQQRILRPRTQAALTRSASGSRHSTGMYFSEVNVTNKKPIERHNSNVRSAEDISSGYSSQTDVHVVGSGAVVQTGTASTSSMKTRNRGRRGELDVLSYDDVGDGDFNPMPYIDEEDSAVMGPYAQNMGCMSIGFADLIASPENFASNTTYTIDAGKIFSLMRLLEMQNENQTVLSETSEECNDAIDDDNHETFVDCSNKLQENVRPSYKKRRAPPPPSISHPATEDVDAINFSSDINSLDVDGLQTDDEIFRKRSKSDASTSSSSRKLLNGFSFFRMKNAK